MTDDLSVRSVVEWLEFYRVQGFALELQVRADYPNVSVPNGCKDEYGNFVVTVGADGDCFYQVVDDFVAFDSAVGGQSCRVVLPCDAIHEIVVPGKGGVSVNVLSSSLMKHIARVQRPIAVYPVEMLDSPVLH